MAFSTHRREQKRVQKLFENPEGKKKQKKQKKKPPHKL
jgi:hypothetical protein